MSVFSNFLFLFFDRAFFLDFLWATKSVGHRSQESVQVAILYTRLEGTARGQSSTDTNASVLSGTNGHHMVGTLYKQTRNGAADTYTYSRTVTLGNCTYKLLQRSSLLKVSVYLNKLSIVKRLMRIDYEHGLENIF